MRFVKRNGMDVEQCPGGESKTVVNSSYIQHTMARKSSNAENNASNGQLLVTC